MADTRYVHALDTRHVAMSLLSGFVAIWALAGGAGLITGTIGLGAEIEARLPFDSPVFAGIALALIVGVPMSIAAVTAARADARAPLAAMAAGALLVGWIVVQVLMIREFSWLQPICVLAGAAVFALGAARLRRGIRDSETGIR